MILYDGRSGMLCPDENVLAAYVDGELTYDRRVVVEQHIDGCEPCRSLVSDLARLQAHESELDVTQAQTTSHATNVSTIAEARSARRSQQIIAGTLVGEYVVTGPIGAGGMGTVYAAIHPRIGKRAAIKVLRLDFARDPRVLVRFENEARAVNAIGHENIVDIFGFGELPEGNPYFVMEHVEGESLGRWSRRHGAVPLAKAMPILRGIFDAVAAAHERGIVHRDLKPGNIMVGGTETAPTVKVLDFGLAKIAPEHREDELGDLTKPGVAMGTPSFMSPEQLRGQVVDHRSDIYALGVLVYQLLCGRAPFEGGTPTEISLQHLYEPPERLSSLASLPAGVDHVLVSALAKDPVQRPASVRAFLDALERCAADVTRDPTMPTQARSRRWLVASLAVIVAMAGAVFAKHLADSSDSRTAELPPSEVVSPTATGSIAADAGSLATRVEAHDDSVVEASDEAIVDANHEPNVVADDDTRIDAGLDRTRATVPLRHVATKPVRRAKPANRKPTRARATSLPALPRGDAATLPPPRPTAPAVVDDDDMLLGHGAAKKAPR
ncbi:MAG: protein kinase [Myxococcota bacterium]|nr:protein kinase [Myxococcota bacterium]